MKEKKDFDIVSDFDHTLTSFDSDMSFSIFRSSQVMSQEM